MSIFNKCKSSILFGITGATLAFAATPSKAVLAETLKQSIANYGQPTRYISGSYRCYTFRKANWNIIAYFNTSGLCAYISYSHSDGSDITEPEFVKLFMANNPSGLEWNRYNNNPTEFWDGGMMFAKYYWESQVNTADSNKTRTVPTLRFATLTALQQLGFLGAPETNEPESNRSVDL